MPPGSPTRAGFARGGVVASLSRALRGSSVFVAGYTNSGSAVSLREKGSRAVLHHLPERIDLPHMVQSMNAVELSPFAGRQRTKHSMDQYVLPAAETPFTQINGLIHLTQVFPD